MLPKKHRLTKHADVAKTTARGRSFFSKSFILKLLLSPKQNTAQFSIIASVKVSKSAVVRNRLKRIIRQAIHTHINKIKSGKYAIILKQSATIIPSNELAEETTTALVRSKLLKL